MNDFDDEELISFIEEAEGICNEMEQALDNVENGLDEEIFLEQYGQLIDRIYGTCSILGYSKLGIICELGKLIGYKASQHKDMALRAIIVAVLFDTVDVVRAQLKNLQGAKAPINMTVFIGRLEWLSEKLKSVERASMAVTPKAPGELDNLIKKLDET